MSHTFTRQSLYDLAWSEPIQSLAKKLSLSDRGLAKICIAANIPVPARGYWAKKQAGKPVSPVALPPRALGQTDFVHIGRDWYRNDSEDAEILSTPIPPPPVFTPAMEAVRAQAARLIAKAPLPLRDTHGWHSQIQKLLTADEERARKQRADPYPSSWNAPLFDGPFEVRRLRILNALFVCLTRCGMSPHIGDKYGRDLSVTVGTTGVPLVLDSMTAAKQIERERQGYGFMARGPKDRMRLGIAHRWSGEKLGPSWEDEQGKPLERRLREIATEIVVFGEQAVRDGAQHAHEWRIKRKADLEEAERKRKAEEERRRRERIAKAEKARVDHLLAQADALHRAQQIRAYVDSVRNLNATSAEPMAPEELESWAGWALAQADRIDPVVSGAFRTRPAEPDE
ncbi:MAG: hypothetical protein ABS36_08615 [Acidobacteria bacterium SCN 69-37]|nr:MAG: hypothetical protein ABS36_08615 [Acidobacteria bacterium SCN 69-37]